ncbi:hypothetical protein [Methanocella sp. MCL-LM]|uniref:hypothetical protein n=1 Tax=Methanocella sp. MCL-LM TaxID=3412035 RepID=UPI003C740C76
MAESLPSEYIQHDPKYDDFGFDASRSYTPLTIEEYRQYDEWVEDHELFDLSLMVADTMTAFDNQKVVILVQGPVGSGKSYFALNLGWNVAMRLALHFYGDPRYWRKYFNPSTIAIMGREEIDNLIKNSQKHSVNLLDDVFASMDRSEWATEMHRAINSIMVADRTQNTATIITIPRAGMLDVIVRGLAQYRTDMKRNVYCKRLGFGEFTFVILFFNPFDQKKGATVAYQKYIRTGRVDWETGFVALPPKEIREMYDECRQMSLEKLMEEKRNMGKKNDDGREPTAGDQLFDWLYSNPEMLAKQDNGKYMSSKTITREFCRSTKRQVSESYARDIISSVRAEMKESGMLV